MNLPLGLIFHIILHLPLHFDTHGYILTSSRQFGTILNYTYLDFNPLWDTSKVKKHMAIIFIFLHRTVIDQNVSIQLSPWRSCSSHNSNIRLTFLHLPAILLNLRMFQLVESRGFFRLKVLFDFSAVSFGKMSSSSTKLNLLQYKIFLFFSQNNLQH